MKKVIMSAALCFLSLTLAACGTTDEKSGVPGTSAESSVTSETSSAANPDSSGDPASPVSVPVQFLQTSPQPMSRRR